VRRWPSLGCWPRATTSPRIPGTKRVSRVEENVAAEAIELSAEQLHKLNSLTPAAGDSHNEAQMQMIDRCRGPRVAGPPAA
jgi:diketogulonate reductase-like aldo/keto reductase